MLNEPLDVWWATREMSRLLGGADLSKIRGRRGGTLVLFPTNNCLFKTHSALLGGGEGGHWLFGHDSGLEWGGGEVLGSSPCQAGERGGCGRGALNILLFS